MITVKSEDSISYSRIKNSDENIVFYPDIFSGQIVNKVIEQIYKGNKSVLTCLTIGLTQLTRKAYVVEKKQMVSSGSLSCVFLEDSIVKVQTGKKKMEIPCKRGSLIIFGSKFRENSSYKLPNSTITFIEKDYLANVYMNTQSRIQYGELVTTKLQNIRQLPLWKQCIQNHIKLDIIGKGSYGNVYKTRPFNREIDSLKFAVKFSRLKPESMAKPYSRDFSSWYEVFFLKDIFKPLIQKGVCPNLPLLYDAFTCKDCMLNINDKDIISPCVITVVELADGDFKNYLNIKNHTDNELYSALFQIMAGLCAIQKYGQIMNFDIKKENILYYKITPGGYFQYTIMGKKFYVPNYGYLFVINDFGISRSMSPKYPMYKSDADITFRLGSRYAFIQDGKFIPIDVKEQVDGDDKFVQANKITWSDGTSSMGAEFRMYRKNNEIIPLQTKSRTTSLLSSSDFFEHPEVVPPFEFYNDTQDAIRIFTGGKRTTQKGFHRVHPNMSKKIIEQIKPYLGKGESMKDGMFSTNPAQVLACYFILDFFGKYTDFTQKKENVIGIYEI
jgi:serine/threonine protein kinase